MDRLAPSTMYQRQVVCFLHYFPGSSSDTIAEGLAYTTGAALSAIGSLIELCYIERDGLGGYRSTGKWSPDGARPETVPAWDEAPLLVAIDNVIDLEALRREARLR